MLPTTTNKGEQVIRIFGVSQLPEPYLLIKFTNSVFFPCEKFFRSVKKTRLEGGGNGRELEAIEDMALKFGQLLSRLGLRGPCWLRRLKIRIK